MSKLSPGVHPGRSEMNSDDMIQENKSPKTRKLVVLIVASFLLFAISAVIWALYYYTPAEKTSGFVSNQPASATVPARAQVATLSTFKVVSVFLFFAFVISIALIFLVYFVFIRTKSPQPIIRNESVVVEEPNGSTSKSFVIPMVLVPLSVCAAIIGLVLMLRSKRIGAPRIGNKPDIPPDIRIAPNTKYEDLKQRWHGFQEFCLDLFRINEAGYKIYQKKDYISIEVPFDCKTLKLCRTEKYYVAKINVLMIFELQKISDKIVIPIGLLDRPDVYQRTEQFFLPCYFQEHFKEITIDSRMSEEDFEKTESLLSVLEDKYPQLSSLFFSTS